MRLKSALRRGVAAAVIAGIVVSSGIPAYAGTWDIADGDITVKAGDAEGPNNVKQGDNDFVKDEGDTVITGESKENTVTIDTSEGNVNVTFDDLKIDASDKGEAAVRVEGNGDVTIELDGDNELKSGSYNAGLEKNGHESEGTLTIKDDKGKDGSLTAEGGEGGSTYGKYALCEGPTSWFWGGTWICVYPKTDNAKEAGQFIYTMTADADAMQKYVDARGDFVNNKGVMSATTEAGTNSNPLFGGQDQFQILFNSADKIDMSIASEYDAKINTDLQNAVQDYCNGVTSSEDDCLNAFLDAVAADVTDITVE